MASARQIVIEIGGKHVRGGFSGEVKPRFTLVHSIFHCGVPLRVYLNELFQKIFIHYLHVKAKQFNVLLVESLLLQRNIRDMLISVLLKDFQVRHIHSFMTSVLSLTSLTVRIYLVWQVLAVSIQPDLMLGIVSSGTSSGTILNIGANECQSMCFVDGRPLLHTLQGTASLSLHRVIESIFTSPTHLILFTLSETVIGVSFAEHSFRHSLEAVLETTVAERASSEVFRRGAKSPEVWKTFEYLPYCYIFDYRRCCKACFFFAARICVNFHSSNHRLMLPAQKMLAQIWKCFQRRVCRTLYSHYQKSIGQIV